MRIRVLGSAAGGGFPQWNCGCENCRGLREGTIKAMPRMQESVCLSANGDDWVLIQASPDIRHQIESFSLLHPRDLRRSPIQAIVLTNGDLDHCLGLLSLRESYPLVIYATERVHQGFIDGNVLYRTLQRFPTQVTWKIIKLGCEERLRGADGDFVGLSLEAFAVPGQLPLHLRGRLPESPEDNIGVKIREPSTGRSVVYLSTVKQLTAEVCERMQAANCVFFDGTFWTEDELTALDQRAKRAQDMAHLHVGGEGGSLSVLSGRMAARRIFIHINNTNPMLREDSSEREAVCAAGWEVAYDGMELKV